MFRNVAHSEEWENTTVTIYRIVFFHHLSRERISSQQDFGIKWQHKDLKSNGSTAGRTFLSAAGGFAGQPITSARSTDIATEDVLVSVVISNI